MRRTLLHHGYSAFSLAIIEYIDITNLSFDKSKELILGKEQNHLDKSLPEYNILKVAGSLLGFIHSADTIAKMRKPKTEEQKAKFSATRGTSIFVYDTQGTLLNNFSSGRKAAKHFDCSQSTIMKYSRNGLVFKRQWKLSTSLITKE
jgi:hypothetical protein